MDQSSATRTVSGVRESRQTQSSRQRGPIAQPDIFSEEFDDIWPSQAPSSVRRYHSDVKSVHGRSLMRGGVQADATEPGFGEQSSLRQERLQHAVPVRSRAQQTVKREEDVAVNDEIDEDRRPSGAVSTRSGRSSRRDVNTEDFPVIPEMQRLTKQRQKKHERWIALAIIAAVVMMLGWYVVNAIVGWVLVTQDDMRYGRPRTYQTDQVVGHSDSRTDPSHFIAINLNRHVEVIEFPGGDATHAHVYMGPVLVGAGQDLAAVTLTFQDLNHDGRPDMIVNVQNSHYIFINAGDQFRDPRPGEIDLH